MKWYLNALKKYAEFSGRARRKEYWMFTLFHIIFAFVAIGLDVLIGIGTGGMGIGVITIIYFLALIIPSLALVVRRLHDTGKSGWMYFVSFIPFIGGLWLLILMLIEGDMGDNEYGPDPKKENVGTNNETLDAQLVS